MDDFVHFRGKVLRNIVKVDDERSKGIIEVAELLAPSYRDHAFKAEVTRSDGMIIHLRNTDIDGLYFKRAACGLNGISPRHTARVLEIFGFGHKDEILSQLKTGGIRAYVELHK